MIAKHLCLSIREVIKSYFGFVKTDPGLLQQIFIGEELPIPTPTVSWVLERDGCSSPRLAMTSAHFGKNNFILQEEEGSMCVTSH